MCKTCFAFKQLSPFQKFIKIYCPCIVKAFKKYIIKNFRCTRKRFRRCRTCTDFKTAKNFYLIGIFYFTMLNIFIIYRKIFTD